MSQVVFNRSQDEEIVFHQSDLIRLKPFGIALDAEGSRPFLLLKDERGVQTLPVALNPLEAGMTVSQSALSALPASPHRFTSLLLQSLDIEPLQCVFVQIKGVHQYVRIYFRGHPLANSLKLRADEAMSLCLHLGIPIYATQKFIDDSKVMSAEIHGLSEGLKKQRHLVIRDHHYLM